MWHLVYGDYREDSCCARGGLPGEGKVAMIGSNRLRWAILVGIFAVQAFALYRTFAPDELAAREKKPQRALPSHIVIGWNDLGMHCMNQRYEWFCILPPYNNLWAQVVHRGSPPQLVQSGVAIDYRFPANTYSVGKINFWDYDDALFGTGGLADNIGLTGHGLSGSMEWNGGAYEVTGVPVTPYDDSASTVLQPYQLAELSLRFSGSSALLDQSIIVAPVSIEMDCQRCHHEDGMSTEQVILEEHDEVDGQSLTARAPVLCAECHASNALGTSGRPGLPSLSLAIHGKHAEEGEVGSTDCYACHPGTQTQCQRGVMYSAGLRCPDCHGNLSQVASSIRQGRRPWLDEPKCATCHGDNHAENEGQLYRNSTGHGGLYCTACHNSPHAILASTLDRDNLQAERLQGHAGTIADCSVCHTETPSGAGPHGMLAARFRRAPGLRVW